MMRHLLIIPFMALPLLGQGPGPVPKSNQQPTNTGIQQQSLDEIRTKAYQGDAEAQNTLGNIYHFGYLVQQDYFEAVKWYLKAANQGHKGAQLSLSRCYELGQGISKDSVEALKWQKAGREGPPDIRATVHSNYSDADYFPFILYADYVYKASYGELEVYVMHVNVNDEDKAEFLQTVRIDGTYKYTTVYYRKDNNGIKSSQYFKDGTVSEHMVLKFPLKIGTKWSEPNEMIPGKSFVHKVAAVGEIVIVPAGEFRDCVRIEHFNSNGSRSGSSWYAPGVGLVKDEPAKGVLVEFRSQH